MNNLEKKITFTKGSGKSDELEFFCGENRFASLQNPKQGIIPHDMVHYAVEQSAGG